MDRRSHIGRRETIHGLMLVELLAVLVVVGSLATRGVPAFGRWIERDRMDERTRAFLASLSYARAEAARRGLPVRICPAAGDTHCPPARYCAGAIAGWMCGWRVIVPAGAANGADLLLRDVAPAAGVAIINQRAQLLFVPPAGGMLHGGRTKFEFRPRYGFGSRAMLARRCIYIAQTGRARLSFGWCGRD